VSSNINYIIKAEQIFKFKSNILKNSCFQLEPQHIWPSSKTLEKESTPEMIITIRIFILT